MGMVRVWDKTQQDTQDLLDRICKGSGLVVVSEVKPILGRENSWEAYAAPEEQPLPRRYTRPLGAQLRRGHR